MKASVQINQRLHRLTVDTLVASCSGLRSSQTFLQETVDNCSSAAPGPACSGQLFHISSQSFSPAAYGVTLLFPLSHFLPPPSQSKTKSLMNWLPKSIVPSGKSMVDKMSLFQLLWQVFRWYLPRATTRPLVRPCISDITGHPILSLNY